MSTKPRDDGQETSRFDEVTAGGLAAAVTAASAGAAGDLLLFPGAGIVVSPVLQAGINLAGQALEHRARRAAAAADEACRHAGRGPDFLEEMAHDEQRLEMAVRAIAAASQTTLDAKIRALGRALANGALAKDDALVDHESFVIDALSRIEAPHVKILHIMEQTRVPQRNGVLYRSTDLAWDFGALRKEYPQATTALPAVVATLAGLGAIRDIAVGQSDYVPTYELEPFGRDLLARLQAAASDG